MSLDLDGMDYAVIESSQDDATYSGNPIKNAAQTDLAQWVKANPDAATRLLFVNQSADDAVLDALLETAV